jgi:choline dehydrogenase-like flavoprotein
MAATEYLLDARGVFSLMHPLSRGYVEIASSDPFEYPVIDFRYVTNPVDMNIHVDSIRFLRKVMATPQLTALGWNETRPGIAKTSDEDLGAFIKERLSSMYHACCTNPMQPLGLGVVDSKLKVYGTLNLRYVCCVLIRVPILITADNHKMMIEWLIAASCLLFLERILNLPRML